MIPLIIKRRNEIYFRFMNSTYIALFFSILTFVASAGIILFMRAIRLSKKNALKQGLYFILVSFICGIIMMNWIISTI